MPDSILQQADQNPYIIMTKMINATTGVEMWVADDRVQTYLERGHALASPPDKPKAEKPAVKRKRKTSKK